jgi:hypothetical protein
MAASLLENGGVPNATTPETRINAKNQGESETDKVLFFNRPQGFLMWPHAAVSMRRSM